MDKKLVLSVYIIGLISYLLPTLSYAYELINNIDKLTTYQTANIFILMIAFGLLSYGTYNDLFKKNLSLDVENLFTYPKQYGYGLICMQIGLSMFLPLMTIHNYHIFGFIAYLLMAIKQYMGIFILILFYILSSFYKYNDFNKLSITETIYIISKLTLILYYGIFITNLKIFH